MPFFRPGQSYVDANLLRRHHLTEKTAGYILLACAVVSVLTTIGIVVVLLAQALNFFADVSVVEFLTGTEWTALFQNQQQWGVLPLVSATLMVTLLSLVVAIPIGLMSAIFLSEYASPRTRAILKPVLELLAGIPTIIYGFFALTFITPEILKRLWPQTSVYNVLAASIAVGIMIVPLIASLSEDAIRSVPSSMREGAYALGATKLEVSTRIIVPAALSGIVASFILATSRAVGETMIVALAAGAKAQMVTNPLEPGETMTGYIVQVVSGDASRGTSIYYSLFAVGLLLFVMTLALNIFSHWFVRRFREEYE
ncbi:MAG: phosphate ABC transporter permease subunit PstC [Thermomicrobiales bacterium]|nr:phosphate ABC transporter permease subunit PstC [Thermomicrobiales bacterium]MCO5221149.1 phosphate ABC transporter permease subunit PstC [Thermomicrobiales bacterium]